MSQSTLNSLYPWQAARGGAEPDLRASVSEKMRQGQAWRESFFAEQTDSLIDMARALAGCFAAGGRLFTMGNGGSACDAAHIAVEFTHPVITGRPALPCVSLVADTALLTAIANDIGVEQVFVRALAAQARAGDAVLGVSTSGNSENLLQAFAYARENGVLSMGLSGAGGGSMASAGLDHCLIVPGDSVHRIQEVQLQIYHLLWELVHALLEARA